MISIQFRPSKIASLQISYCCSLVSATA